MSSSFPYRTYLVILRSSIYNLYYCTKRLQYIQKTSLDLLSHIYLIYISSHPCQTEQIVTEIQTATTLSGYWTSAFIHTHTCAAWQRLDQNLAMFGYLCAFFQGGGMHAILPQHTYCTVCCMLYVFTGLSFQAFPPPYSRFATDGILPFFGD